MNFLRLEVVLDHHHIRAVPLRSSKPTAVVSIAEIAQFPRTPFSRTVGNHGMAARGSVRGPSRLNAASNGQGHIKVKTKNRIGTYETDIGPVPRFLTARAERNQVGKDRPAVLIS
jgi:hypothetical protein